MKDRRDIRKARLVRLSLRLIIRAWDPIARVAMQQGNAVLIRRRQVQVLLVNPGGRGHYGHFWCGVLFAARLAEETGTRLVIFPNARTESAALRGISVGGKRARMIPPWVTRLVRRLLFGQLLPSHSHRRIIRDQHKLWAGGPVQIAEYDNQPMTAAAREIGFIPGRFVMLHVRDSGFKDSVGYKEKRVDRARNSRMETYLPAIDFLVNMGLKVVRFGDPSMKPLEREGVINLATMTERRFHLELWAAINCRLFICCDSGPYLLSRFSSAPCLGVNVVDLINYFASPQDRFICKRAIDPATREPMSVAEMIEGFLLACNSIPSGNEKMQAANIYSYQDNSPEEILEAVKEIMAGDPGEPSPEQLAFKKILADRIASRWAGQNRSIDYTPGKGHISRSFAAKTLWKDAIGRAS